MHVVNNKIKRSLGRIGIIGDDFNSYCTIFANGLLMSFLVLEPLFVDYMDMVIVVNIFYNVYLAYVTFNICRLWKLTDPSDQ